MVKKHLGPDEVEILKDDVRPADPDVEDDDDDDDEDNDGDEPEDEDLEKIESDEDRAPNEIAEAFERWGVDPDEYFERT